MFLIIFHFAFKRKFLNDQCAVAGAARNDTRNKKGTLMVKKYSLCYSGASESENYKIYKIVYNKRTYVFMSNVQKSLYTLNHFLVLVKVFLLLLLR